MLLRALGRAIRRPVLSRSRPSRVTMRPHQAPGRSSRTLGPLGTPARWIVTAPASDDALRDLMKNAEADKLHVIDWTAAWCGPCQAAAPEFEKMSDLHTEAVFLKCDVDVLVACSREAQISAVPSFHFVKNGELLDTVSGADLVSVEQLVKQHK